MSTKIGFNNFKAFGTTMQTFSKKPITLVYGPNSVGKSSLLHSQVYLEYSKREYSDSDVFKTSFAGDEIDFGGFQNIVHKHDLSNILVHEENYSDHMSFLWALGIVNFNIDKKSLECDSEKQFYKYISTAQSMKTSIELAQNEEGEITTKVRVFIDNEELFCFTRKTQKIEMNTAHKALGEFQKISKKYESFKKESNVLDEFSDIHFNFRLMVDHILDTKKIQYYGPLRHYPERYEMFSIKKNNFESEEAEIFAVTKSTKIIVKTVIKLVDFNTKLFGKNRLFKAPINLIILIIELFAFLLSKNYRAFMTSDDDFLDLWNRLLSRKLKFIRKTKFDSIEVWQILMNSVEIRGKINAWLSDKKKLKSNYYLHVNEKRINSRGVFVRRLHKLLGMEEKSAFFKQFEQKELHWEDKLEKVIDFIWNGVEKLFHFKPPYEQQLVFTDISKNTEVTPRDMGLGISQALPILVSTFGSKNANIYLEQPELHLHPAVQMELMDEFIRSMRENDNTFFIESHSEHMLLRVMKRMRQTADGTLQDELLKLTPDDVCLLYVDNDGESTYLQELRLSPKGTLLDHWPHGFFEEGYKERFS